MANRLDGLLDEPRPGKPRQISDETIEKVVVQTLETTPKGATSMAAQRAAIEEFLAVTNDGPQPFKWTANADDILAKIARFAQRTLAAHPAP